VLICFHCGKGISMKNNEHYMVALDTPYTNLFFCKPDCWEQVNGDLIQYLTQNEKRVYTYVEKSREKGKK
jgi:hypothetical protein